MSAVRDIEDIYELSPLQQGMLVETLLAPGSGVYHEQMSFPVAGGVRVGALRAAWQHVADLHPILRTSFHFEDIDKPLQVVHRRAEVPFRTEDWTGVAPATQRARLERLLFDDAAQGFDLGRAPLMRVCLVRLSPSRLQFVWSFHHALMDGWSVQIVLRDVGEAYAALAAGRPAPVRRPAPYAEYVGWLQQQDLGAAECYWRDRLAGFTEATPLSVERLGDGGGFADVERVLGAETTLALERLARERRVTLNTVVQAAWALLLGRYAGSDDVAFGAVVSGRPADLRGAEEMVGLFINTLPVRVRIPHDRPVAQWMAELQRDAAESRRFEYSPLMSVIGWSEVGRGRPLLHTALVFENYPAAKALPGAPAGAVRHIERTNLPLTLLVVPGERLLLKALFDASRLDAPAVGRMLGHLEVILGGFAEDADRPPGAIPILGSEERRWLDERNATRRPYRLDWTLAGRFGEQAARRPRAAAFIAGDDVLTYAELDHRSDAVAARLVELGVRPGEVVGLCAGRTFALPAGLLGILKAGAAFAALDRAFPPARVAAMIESAGIDVVVADEAHAGLAGIRALVPLDAPARPLVPPARIASGPGDRCYVVFTSGSTGRPKAVEVEQRQVLNRFEWFWEAHPFRPGEVACAKTAIGFVDAIWELLGPLLAGVPTVLVPGEQARDVDRLVATLAGAAVTRIWLVPSLLRAMLERHADLRRRLPALDFWVVSGEPLTLDLRDAFAAAMPDATLYNLYGTSEVWDATWHDPARDRPDPRHVSIGRPIANVEVHVLDPRGERLPVGVPGELLVGGDGLARGYLGDPRATAERFVPDPFGGRPGGRLYRTGDRARWLPDGTLEHLGRFDGLVKLRGHRVELAEVEAVLRSHPRVRDAGVRLDGDRLVAAVAAGGVDEDELRAWLRARLPAVMVPAAITVLEELPLTGSGKLDRLRIPVPTRAAARPAARAPTEEEARVAEMVADVLRIGAPGVLEDFFGDLGGDSLQAARLVARVADAFGVQLALRPFFERPTVANLVAEVERARRTQSPAPAPLVPADRERYRAAAGEG